MSRRDRQRRRREILRKIRNAARKIGAFLTRAIEVVETVVGAVT